MSDSDGVAFPGEGGDKGEEQSAGNSPQTRSESSSSTQQNGDIPSSGHGENGAGGLNGRLSQTKGSSKNGGQREKRRRSSGGGDSGVTDWSAERTRTYEQPETDLELLRQVDEFLDRIDTDLETAKERARAGDHYQVSNRVGDDITTQSKLGFDYVRDDGIVVDGDSYIALSTVKPTRWLSKSEEEQTNTMAAYASFLQALQWGIAVPCYPAAFDFSTYLDAIYEEGAKRAAEGTNPLLDYARRFHIKFTSQEIDPEEVKKKEYYIVCRVDANRVRAAMDSGGVFSTAWNWTKRKLGLIEAEQRTEEACVTELRSRQSQMHRRIAGTGVEADTITERREAMELLYHYYNHVKPVLDSFDMATYTKRDESGGHTHGA